jgi:hypothetical protein
MSPCDCAECKATVDGLTAVIHAALYGHTPEECTSQYPEPSNACHLDHPSHDRPRKAGRTRAVLQIMHRAMYF